MQTTEATIRNVVQEVLAQLAKQSNGSNGVPRAERKAGDWGVFDDTDQAIAAANEGFRALSSKGMEERAKIVEIVKRICADQAEELGRLEFQETKVGRLDHKIEKLQIIKKVPGTEWLRTEAMSGDHGLTVIEYAPFGVIGTITPVTHSLPTLAGNVINMVAAGNTLVVNPHPSGKKIACEGVRRFNRAIYAATGLENVITIVSNPTLESADRIFNHRDVKMLCVTGGPGVARAAMASRKKAVVAGPGNPPVLVDESACLQNAAESIIAGAGYDNNLLCIGEKEVFVVESVFDRFMQEMDKAGAVRLNATQVDQLSKVAFTPPENEKDHYHVNRDLVGQHPYVLAKQIGLPLPESTPLLFGETDEHNPFVAEEQMMPFVPIIRCRNAEHGMDLCEKYEHGFRHTSLIHSRNVRNMSIMGKRMDTTLFIKNGPSPAGLGLGGEGYLSFSIATPTGEGVTTPLTFTRQRRCTMVDDLRIV
ncbi:MAG: aldehyde dehydrogenase family protein [Rubinisphaera brasiliensis]|uniref:aldehyde dehydrogenase family protein n=1 Tax=Rubinisphaera brasiliensis TaxID=119 RepID=UPI003918842A